MTQPVDVDSLLAQIADMTQQIANLQGQVDSLTFQNSEVQGQLAQTKQAHDNTQAVVSTISVRQGAFLKRFTRLQNYLANPPKPIGQMTKAEILQFLSPLQNAINTAVPDDPNQDTVLTG